MNSGEEHTVGQGSQPGIPHVRPGPIHWLSVPIRAAIERAVARDVGHAWRIAEEYDYSEFACHPCAIVSGGSRAVFFKWSDAVDATRQFEIEIEGLETLSREAGVRVPRPMGIVPVETGAVLLMEALEAVPRGPHQWREIGSLLACVHRVKGPAFGFERDGFWGPLPQDNTLTPDWTAFFRDRRLEPLLRTAIDSGNLPVRVASHVETVGARLTEWCDRETAPTLLHGDAQANNFISTAAGAYAMDPAVYFGDPEMDLAATALWQPVPDDLLAAYQEEAPIDPGFAERRDLWRIPAYLAAVALEGPAFLGLLTRALRKYL